jgi:hypothetical protein
MEVGDVVVWTGNPHRSLYGSHIRLTYVNAQQKYEGKVISGNDPYFTPGHRISGDLINVTLFSITNKEAKKFLKRS